MPITAHKNIALLIYAENISSKYIKLIFYKLSAYCFATYKRVLGKAEVLTVWRDIIFDYAMTPVMQFNYINGKNVSDSALIIDLVTFDSDFTKLAIRLREAGMFVIGMGEQKTSLLNSRIDTRNMLPSESKLKDEISRILGTVFQGVEWVRLADLGNALPKNIPDFSQLKKLMEKFFDRFDMREMSGNNSIPDLYMRDR